MAGQAIVNKVNLNKRRYRDLYLLLIPAMVILIIFRYFPIYGLIIAFQDYTVFKGVFHSSFNGFENMIQLFRGASFDQAIKNTIYINIFKIVFAFPAPIILALMLNEVRHSGYRRMIQTLSYLPYFVSWVVMAGLLGVFFNPTDGMITLLLNSMGIENFNIYVSNTWFRPMLVITDIYKNIGYEAIIFLAAITGLDTEMFEAAVIDGANRFQRIFYITIPSILYLIVILFVLRLGQLLEAGFMQVFMLYNPVVYETADIIDTYVYRAGLQGGEYGLASAAQLFKSAVGLVLIIGANRLVKKFYPEGRVW